MHARRKRPLTALREAIDREDDALLEHLSRRLRLVREVGALKEEDGLEVHQPAREAALVDRLLGKAAGLGLEVGLVQAVWREILKASRAAQASGGGLADTGGEGLETMTGQPE